MVSFPTKSVGHTLIKKIKHINYRYKFDLSLNCVSSSWYLAPCCLAWAPGECVWSVWGKWKLEQSWGNEPTHPCEDEGGNMACGSCTAAALTAAVSQVVTKDTLTEISPSLSLEILSNSSECSNTYCINLRSSYPSDSACALFRSLTLQWEKSFALQEKKVVEMHLK